MLDTIFAFFPLSDEYIKKKTHAKKLRILIAVEHSADGTI